MRQKTNLLNEMPRKARPRKKNGKGRKCCCMKEDLEEKEKGHTSLHRSPI